MPGLESLHDEVGTSPGRFDLPGDATVDRSETVPKPNKTEPKGNTMKKCLIVTGLVLFIGGGIYVWWWIQPMRQMSTLSQAAAIPAMGSEEFSQEYPQLASVFEWSQEGWVEQPLIQPGGPADGGEVINWVYQVSSSRVFYGAYVMFAGLLIACIPLFFKVFNLLLGRFVVRPVKGAEKKGAEKFAPNYPPKGQQG